jgi:hypothetical protein
LSAAEAAAKLAAAAAAQAAAVLAAAQQAKASANDIQTDQQNLKLANIAAKNADATVTQDEASSETLNISV